jgi:hypothetical protein
MTRITLPSVDRQTPAIAVLCRSLEPELIISQSTRPAELYQRSVRKICHPRNYDHNSADHSLSLSEYDNNSATDTCIPKKYDHNSASHSFSPEKYDNNSDADNSFAPEFSTIRSTPRKRPRNLYSHNSATNATTIRPVTDHV